MADVQLNTRGPSIVAAIDAELAVGEEWRQGAISITVGVNASTNTVALHSTFSGTLYYIDDPVNRDRDYIETTATANNTTLAITAGLSSGSAVTLNGAAGSNTLFQSVLKTAQGGYSGVSRKPITIPVVAPVLSDPAGTPTGETTATATVTSDTFGAGSGTVYGGLWLAAATPSAADIKAGTGVQGSTGLRTAIDDADGAISFNFIGLTASTAYKAHFIQTKDGVDSNVATSAQFTTNVAAGAGDPTVAFTLPKTGGSNTNTFTSPTFTAGTPLLLFVMEENSISGADAKTVTVNGVNVPSSGLYNRGNYNLGVHYIANPTAGDIVVTQTNSTNGMQLWGVHVPGATGLGVLDPEQATSSALTVPITPAAAGKVIYAGLQGGPDNYAYWSNATHLQQSLGVQNTQFSSAIGWEPVGTAGVQQNALFSVFNEDTKVTPISGSALAVAVEVN